MEEDFYVSRETKMCQICFNPTEYHPSFFDKELNICPDCKAAICFVKNNKEKLTALIEGRET